MQKEEASVRFPDFQNFATLFSPLLSLRLSRLLVVFSLFSNKPHLPSPIRSSSSRVLLFLGFERERERKREGTKVVLRSSTLIIIIKYDQTRHQRRIQVAEIRSEEHQIGLVPEKLLPMHERRREKTVILMRITTIEMIVVRREATERWRRQSSPWRKRRYRRGIGIKRKARISTIPEIRTAAGVRTSRLRHGSGRRQLPVARRRNNSAQRISR